MLSKLPRLLEAEAQINGMVYQTSTFHMSDFHQKVRLESRYGASGVHGRIYSGLAFAGWNGGMIWYGGIVLIPTSGWCTKALLTLGKAIGFLSST